MFPASRWPFDRKFRSSTQSFCTVFATAGIVATSCSDQTKDENKEEGPEKSAVTQITASTSHGHHDKRDNSGRFTS